MNKRDQLTLLGGLGLGAGLMYLLDPQGGGRRRALARDKAVHGVKVGSQALRKTSIDVSNRTRGLMAQAASHLHKDDADDLVLVERVRAKLGRCVSHPAAIAVHAEDGRIILSGPVLASELDGMLSHVQKVKGVHEVENRLEVHDSADGVPSLQGEGRNGNRFSLRGMAPRTAATLGLGALVGTVGLGLLARSSKGRDLAKPLLDSRWVKGRASSDQLGW
jgi:hypothetical protein